MTAEAWLRWVATAAFLAVAGYCVARLAAAPRAPAGYPGRHRAVDIAHVLMGIGMAAMASPVGGPLPMAGWQAIFLIMAAWFAGSWWRGLGRQHVPDRQLAAHQAGRIRATEVRSSDYLEANSIFNTALAKPLRAGKRANVPAALDTPHSWTAIADVARTLATVATDERGWGKAWLVPTNPPQTVRQLATRFTEVNGLPPARLGGLPYPVLWTAGLFSPMIRELRTTRYQFTRPFVIDSSLTERTFDLTPTDLDTALRNVV